MQYDFNLLANGGQTIEVVGRFVTYKEGLGKIRVKLSKGGFVDLVPGQGVEDVEFTQITINDLSGVLNKGAVLAGAFKFRDATISGSVQVIDGGKNRTFTGAAYWGSNYCGVSAGNIGHSQLWNPSGSGKKIIVRQCSVASLSADGIFGIGITAAPLSGAGVFLPQNKLSNGGVSIALMKSGFYAASQLGVNYMADIPSKYLVPSALILSEPIVLMPGSGLVSITPVGQSGTTNFEYYEDLL